MVQRYNTGNQVPSSTLPDMNDNLLFVDEYVNKTSGTATSRTGTDVPVLQEQVNARIDGLTEAASNTLAAATEAVASTEQSVILTSQARDEAVNAAASAQNVADANTFYITPDDPDGTIAGLAGTPAGKIFRVPQGVNSNESFRYYLNDNGAAVEKASMVGTALVETTLRVAEGVDKRTQGILSSKKSKYAFEIVDKDGKAIIYSNQEGKFFFPGGASIKGLETDEFDVPEIRAGNANIETISTSVSLAVGLNILTPNKSNRYLYAETDSIGHVLWGTLKDGTKEYMGMPLSQQVGQVKNDFFFIGDSITAFTETTAGAYNDVTRGQKPAVCAQGWPVWAEMLSDGKILKTGLSATGGYRADQILATHVPVAIAAKPKFCVVLAGRNDIVQISNYTYEQSIKAINAIYSELRRSGIIPVCCSMSAQSGNTAAQDVKRYKMNEWIRSYAEKYSLPFVDMHKATTDPATGQWFSGWNYDASHPTAAGAKAMGLALADAMVNWVSNVSPRMAESNTTPEASTNLIANPLLMNVDAPNVPASWAIGNAGTPSLLADPAVKGNVLRIASSDGTTPATRSQTVSVTPGDVLEFSLKFKANSGGENNVWVNSAATPFALTGILAGIRRWAATMDTFGTYSQRFTVPAGVTSLNIAISGLDLSIGQVGLFKITGV